MSSADFPQVRDHHPDLPLPGWSATRALWSTLFLLDYTFGLTTKPDSEGHVVRKSRYPGAVGRLYARLYDRLGRELEEHLGEASWEEPRPVASVDGDDWTPADFARWRRDVNAPLIIRGFLKRSRAVRDWSLDWLADTHGDKRVPCVHFPAGEGRFIVGENVPLTEASVREFCTEDRYRGFYINNVLDVFSKKEFLRDCQGVKINALRGLQSDFVNWFISRSDQTLTPLHAANGDNLFMNIKGEKEWHFIPPQYTPYLLPALSRFAIYAVSEVGEFSPDNYAERYAQHPHFRSIPKFLARLEEGDVLYNPPWWWHNVQNRTSFTLAGAIRYPPHPMALRNIPAFHLCQLIDLVKHPRRSFWSTSIRAFLSDKGKGTWIENAFSKS